MVSVQVGVFLKLRRLVSVFYFFCEVVVGESVDRSIDLTTKDNSMTRRSKL